jgi:hypothetical protein
MVIDAKADGRPADEAVSVVTVDHNRNLMKGA